RIRSASARTATSTASPSATTRWPRSRASRPASAPAPTPTSGSDPAMSTDPAPGPEHAETPVLPHAHAVTWGVAALPHRGPKRELTTERIVEAAIAIADEHGLEAVSMGKVAAAVGVAPMSLYRYVTGKDD